MRFKLELERLSDGQTLRITQNETRYQLIEIDGLEAPETSNSTYERAQIDGVGISNIRVPERQIDMTVVIRGNVDYNRRVLRELCRVRSIIRLHFETQTGVRYIDGYPIGVESNRFEDPSFEYTVSFLCPDPYFKGESDIVESMSRTYPTYFFPFGMGRPTAVTNILRTATINVASENETGIVITMVFTASASTVKIVNATTGEYFQISGYTFRKGDTLVINTIDGQKSCYVNSTTNVIAYVDDESTWFQLQSGDNSFNYILNNYVYAANAEVTFTYTPVYLAL